MYSEQLEQLIQSVIADGVISEKERAVLHKKAAAEGVDEDEIDVYVDGLVSKMKPVTLKTTNIDFKYITKYVAYDNAYYLGQKQFKVNNLSNPRIQTIYLNFFKDNNNRLGISIALIYKKGWKEYGSCPHLLLETETNSIQLRWGISTLDFHSNDLSDNQKYSIEAHYFDEEMLRLLCEAKHVEMSLFNCGTTSVDSYEYEENYNFTNISVDGLVSYAQVFYRSVIDNSSYPDAIIANLKTGKKGIECLSEKQKINLLFADKKQLNKIPSDISCYTQYLDASTHTIHTYIKDGKLITEKKLSVESVQIIDTYHDANGNLIKNMRTQDGDHFDYSFSLNLHAISGKDGNNTFFFEISSKYTGEYRNRFWGINESRLIITVGIDDYELVPIETNENIIRIKEKEHSFYELEDKLLKQLANAKKYKMSLLGNKDNKDNRVVFKNFGLRSDLCFSDYWKQAIELLENKGQGITSVGNLTSTATSGENIINEDLKSNIDGEYMIEGEKGLLSKYGFTKKTIIIYLVVLVISLFLSPRFFIVVFLLGIIYAWLHRPKK